MLYVCQQSTQYRLSRYTDIFIRAVWNISFPGYELFWFLYLWQLPFDIIYILPLLALDQNQPYCPFPLLVGYTGKGRQLLSCAHECKQKPNKPRSSSAWLPTAWGESRTQSKQKLLNNPSLANKRPPKQRQLPKALPAHNKNVLGIVRNNAIRHNRVKTP